MIFIEKLLGIDDRGGTMTFNGRQATVEGSNGDLDLTL